MSFKCESNCISFFNRAAKDSGFSKTGNYNRTYDFLKSFHVFLPFKTRCASSKLALWIGAGVGLGFDISL